jgi:segregation and condensation protein B
MENIRNIIESLLFVADEPLTVDKLKSVLETADTKEIRSALDALADQYVARGGGFRLCEVAGGWQLRSRPEYNEYIKRLLQPSPQRLSRAALETLAIVAYNQPIIRADIEHIRGVDCGGVLRQLLERKLIRVLGRKEIPGRPLIYATSKLFLELFELKNLKDLPTPKEIEEIGIPKDLSADESVSDSKMAIATGYSGPSMPKSIALRPYESGAASMPEPESSGVYAQRAKKSAKISAKPHHIATSPSNITATHSSIADKSGAVHNPTFAYTKNASCEKQKR